MANVKITVESSDDKLRATTLAFVSQQLHFVGVKFTAPAGSSSSTSVADMNVFRNSFVTLAEEKTLPQRGVRQHPSTAPISAHPKFEKMMRTRDYAAELARLVKPRLVTGAVLYYTVFVDCSRHRDELIAFFRSNPKISIVDQVLVAASSSELRGFTRIGYFVFGKQPPLHAREALRRSTSTVLGIVNKAVMPYSESDPDEDDADFDLDDDDDVLRKKSKVKKSSVED